MTKLSILDFVLTACIAVSAPGGDIRWIDGRELPMEGRAFTETVGGPYGRLPAKYANRVTPAVRSHGADSCGISFRFRTNSTTLRIRWSLANAASFVRDRYMTQKVMGGIDVYEECDGKFRLVNTAESLGGPDLDKPDAATEFEVPWTSGHTAIIYLPCRGIVKTFSLGIDASAKIEPSPHARGDMKPVVVYGTSIVHAGCVSRPGLAFPTQVSRHLDLPVVNLGFSGSGKMEPVMCDVVAEADASLYVLDCLWNMNLRELEERFEPFVRRLRGMRPDVPILLCEDCCVDNPPTAKGRFIRGVYERLKAEDPVRWKGLHYMEASRMLPNDPDLTLDHCHPNDAGARLMARAYAGEFARILETPAITTIPAVEMRAVYDEVKTPYKYGVILAPEEGKMLDNPNVFRHGDTWYMMYIVFDKKGYETRFAKSDDLLHWQPLGPVLLRGEKGTWDCAQSDGGPSLMDVRWDGPNTLGTCGGKYWMTYIGGAKTGYETDPLAIGVATTDDPSAAKLWTREFDRPVLAPWDGGARWFEDVTLYKSFVVTDEARTLGGRYVMYYNAKTGGVAGDPKSKPWLESIGMAVSDDMRNWVRYGKEPVILNCDGKDAAALSGDPMIRRIGDKWVMFYFGYQWGPFAGHAGDTFAASRDLVHWTKWGGDPLIRPSESWDKDHAHKPWVIKHGGVVYHFYCAVGDRGRVLALATSKAVGKGSDE